MKRSFMIFVLLIMGVLLVGCTNDTSNSSPSPSTKKVEQSIKEEKPSVVFFINSINFDENRKQLVELQKHKKVFSKFPGDIYVVSKASKEQHNKLKKELKLDFELVSDPDSKMVEKVKLANKNGYAILDKKGNVLHTEEIIKFGEEAEGIIYFALLKVDENK